MKIKMIKQTILILAILVITGTCSKDYVDVRPEGTPLEENYYSTQEEAYSGLISVYDGLGKQSKGFDNMITMFNAGSDDHYAGGGGATDGAGIESFLNYSIDASTLPASYCNDFYQGIFRANILIDKLPEVPMEESFKTRYSAEAKALRAHFYFELVRIFRNIPLIVDPLPTSQIYEVVQADPAEVYQQIEKDLNEAIPDLPITLADLENEAGRLTQGAAMALLGKVYLYQEKNNLAAQTLAEVNGTPGGTSKYGYKLLDDFSDLWTISNKFNSESILASSHSDKSNAGW